MKKVPNILTVFRLALVPVFAALFFSDKSMWALGVYAIAALTDMLDGYIARKYDAITDAGKVLDPLADKLMLITAIASFYIKRQVPLLILIFVCAKEGTMIIGGILLYKRKFVVYAKLLGKLATGIFNIGVLMTFFAECVYPYNVYVLYVAIAFALAAYIQYGVQNVIIPAQKRRNEAHAAARAPEEKKA